MQVTEFGKVLSCVCSRSDQLEDSKVVVIVSLLNVFFLRIYLGIQCRIEFSFADFIAIKSVVSEEMTLPF